MPQEGGSIGGSGSGVVGVRDDMAGTPEALVTQDHQQVGPQYPETGQHSAFKIYAGNA
jgi:hypothetical protein